MNCSKIKAKRQKAFDSNRNIKMASIEQLTEQVAILTQQMAQQRQQQQIQQQRIDANAIDETRFQLTPDQIIRNFDEIPAFSGESSYKLKSFLNTVASVEQLCGFENNNLKRYCLQKTINAKIIGRARLAILEIPDGERNWETVVATLTEKFRPRQTIHQLLYQAKDLKVFNLKDAFEKLTKIKYDANEICDFDNETQFTYISIDRELVQTLKFKLTPIIQLQIDSNKSLSELDNKLFQSEIYISEETIKTSYKINGNNFAKENNSKSNNQYNKNSNFHPRSFPTQNPNAYKNHNDAQNDRGQQSFQNRNVNQNRYQNDSYRQNSGQFRQNFNNNHLQNNYSGQFRQNSNNNSQHNNPNSFRNNNNRTDNNTPMEVDNINRQDETQIEQDVNFQE